MEAWGESPFFMKSYFTYCKGAWAVEKYYNGNSLSNDLIWSLPRIYFNAMQSTGYKLNWSKYLQQAKEKEKSFGEHLAMASL